MAIKFQVTFDAADPKALGEFWAHALGYEADAPPAGHATWEAFLEASGVPSDEWNDAWAIHDPDNDGPRVFFQRVPEPKTAKNRCHLDLRTAAGLRGEERMAALERRAEGLVAWGARRLARFEPDGFNAGHVVMADPEGNEFCLD